MTATTLDRTTVEIWSEGVLPAVPLTASTKIPLGVMVMVVSGTGTALNAADTANGILMGISAQAVDTALGHTKCPIKKIRGWFANDGTISAANIGQKATVLDNQTLSLAATTVNDINAGKILAVDATLGVCIDQTGGNI